VKAVLERDNRLPARVVPRKFDGVFDRLCARADEERFLRERPGARSFSSSASRTYPSYGVTMKQVWMKSAACC